MRIGDRVKYITVDNKVGYGIVSKITDSHIQINDKKNGVIFIGKKRVTKQ